MIFRIIVILLTAIVSFVNCEAARNLVPKELREFRAGKSKYYVVAGDEKVVGYHLSKKKIEPMSFLPGDTLYVQEIFEANSSDDFRKLNLNIDKAAAFVVLSINNEMAVIESEKLEKADMRSMAEKEADLLLEQKKEAGNRAVEEVKSLFQGDNSYPYDITRSLIVFLIATIACFLMANGGLGNSDISILIPVVILVVVYYFQYQLFVNGEKALSDWVKGDSTDELVTMLRMFGLMILLFAFTIWEIFVLYSVLGRIGFLCMGRVNYTISIMIWMAGSVAMAIAVIFFKEHSFTVLKLILSLVGLDILLSIILNRKNPITMITTAVFYISGAFVLIPTYAVTAYAFFWVVAVIMGIGLILLICQPARAVGTVFGAFGQVGTLMSDGWVNLTGGGSFHSSNLNPRNYIKMNDD